MKPSIHPEDSFAIGGVFHDIDHLAEVARAWNLDFFQLGKGAFEGRLFQMGSRGFQIAEAYFSNSLEQNGCPPVEMRTFAIPLDPSMTLRWRGHDVRGDQIMIFPRNGELFSISKSGFHVVTLSMEEELLAEHAESLGSPELADFLNGSPELVSADPIAMRILVNECRAMIRGGRVAAGAGKLPNLGADAKERLILALVAALMGASACNQPGVPSSRLRSAALRRAKEVVNDRWRHPIKVSQLCREAGVSQRTLQYAFEEEFAISPKAWLQARALSQVKRRLRLADPEQVRVADIANEWGYWHMGQFAADYRRAFGELPSETLAR